MIFIYKENATSNLNTLKEYLKENINDGVILEISPSLHKKVEKYLGENMDSILKDPNRYSIEVDSAGFTVVPSIIIRYAEDGETLSSPTRVYLINDEVCIATSNSFKPIKERV